MDKSGYFDKALSKEIRNDELKNKTCLEEDLAYRRKQEKAENPFNDFKDFINEDAFKDGFDGGILSSESDSNLKRPQKRSVDKTEMPFATKNQKKSIVKSRKAEAKQRLIEKTKPGDMYDKNQNTQKGSGARGKYNKARQGKRRFDSKIFEPDKFDAKQTVKREKKSAPIGKETVKNAERFLQKISADDSQDIESANSREAINISKYAKDKAVSGAKYGKAAIKKIQSKRKESLLASKADLAFQQNNALKRYKLLKKNGGSMTESLNKAKDVAIKVARKIQSFIKKNTFLVITLSALLLIFIAVSVTASSLSTALMQGVGSYVAGLSPGSDRDMTDCDLYFDELESDLQERIDRIEEEYPGFDEYIYDLQPIEHDLYKLMAFLSSEYEDYTLLEQKEVLDLIFSQYYSLELTKESQIRYREEVDGEGNTVLVEYEYKTLTVVLNKSDFDEVLLSNLSTVSNREKYENYQNTKGAHQAYSNPFTFDWRENVTSPFGLRVHPIEKTRKFHQGIDIAVPQNTPIQSVCSGEVIKSEYRDIEGNYVVVRDESGYTVHYMHLNERDVTVGDEIKKGDLIGLSGSTGSSTGPHLHIGIKDSSGEYLNPYFLLDNYVLEE